MHFTYRNLAGMGSSQGQSELNIAGATITIVDRILLRSQIASPQLDLKFFCGFDSLLFQRGHGNTVKDKQAASEGHPELVASLFRPCLDRRAIG